MKIGTTKLIAENIPPPNARRLAVFNDGKKVGTVDISTMQPPYLGEKLYSFGLVSDLHLDGVGPNGAYLSQQMTFFEDQGCSFCCHAGDITNIGFWYNPTDTQMYLAQMAEYKNVIDAHPSLPMYGICGNHESYCKPILGNLAELKAYTGRDLYYTMTRGSDVFVFIGQPGGTGYVEREEWITELKWLQATLEANRNKRCFVFEHPPVSDDSGNPKNIHNTTWADLESTLVGVMKHYKNAILFHGHSHLDFNEQLNYSYANYSTKKGFKSVHIPSSSGSRKTIDGEVQPNDAELRGGYIADVYGNHLVLKGYHFKDFKPVPIAQYCIDTARVSIEANTFTDSTGTITT